MQISFAVTAKLFSAFVFATQKVQSLYYLHTKFQAPSHFLRLHSLICVGPGRKSRRALFSRCGSNIQSLTFHVPFIVTFLAQQRCTCVSLKEENEELEQNKEIGHMLTFIFTDVVWLLFFCFF